MPVRLSVFTGHFHAIHRPHTLRGCRHAPLSGRCLSSTVDPGKEVLPSEEYVVGASYTAAGRQKLASSPSKSQLLLLRVLKMFLVASLWGEKGAWLCCVTTSLTALTVKSPKEKYLAEQTGKSAGPIRPLWFPKCGSPGRLEGPNFPQGSD